MLIDKGRGIVDLIVNDNVEIFLGGVVLHLGIRQFFRHGFWWDCGGLNSLRKVQQMQQLCEDDGL